MHTKPTSAPILRQGAARAAFTLIELLVVVAIIGVLLAIVLVAGNAVLRAGQRSDTTRLLATISQGLDQFERDHGYYPPLLSENYEEGDWGSPGSGGPDRLVVANDSSDSAPRWFNPYFAGPIVPGESEQVDSNDPRCFNIFSLPLYLLGVGDINGDGDEIYEDPNVDGIEPNWDDGVDGPGFRSPGGDRSWGGSRMRQGPPLDPVGPHRPPSEGRVFGPYVDVSSGRNLERMLEETTVVGQENYAGLYSFVDRWGNPIRYYRDWTLRGANGRSMANVPIELRDATEARDMVGGLYGADFETGMSRIIPEIAGAPYVLLSVGQDGESGHRSGVEMRAMFDGDGAAATEMYEELSDNVRHIP